ncbi:hypothetical protein HBI73_134410 [Parastagonospora nodorum]|nr:hypothetical protein HBI73_134410 [Parastagonospora nodorum]
MSPILDLSDVLFNPDAGTVTVDIVFVHGLNGDRIETWTSAATDEEPEKTTWPKDLLPKACPTARILSFGYNSAFADFYPLTGSKKEVALETTIDTFSTALHMQLANLRLKTETPDDRPIIYVAHSLGGLVVANALSKPHGIDEAAGKLNANTVGVIFMGTPFEGSSIAKWGSLGLRLWSLVSKTEKATVKDLEKRSSRLATINENMAKYIQTRDRDHSRRPLDVVCCFEERPTHMGPKKEKVVDKESATLWLGAKVLSVRATHSAMVKYTDESDSTYITISGILSQWIKNLVEKGDTVKEEDPPHISLGDVHFDRIDQNFGAIAGNVMATKEHGIVMNGAMMQFGPGMSLADLKGSRDGKPSAR